MNTNLGQDGVDQLAFRQGKIRIMIAEEDVAKEQHHPNLCQGGHASVHDLHLPFRCCTQSPVPECIATSRWPPH